MNKRDGLSAMMTSRQRDTVVSTKQRPDKWKLGATESSVANMHQGLSPTIPERSWALLWRSPPPSLILPDPSQDRKTNCPVLPCILFAPKLSATYLILAIEYVAVPHKLKILSCHCRDCSCFWYVLIHIITIMPPRFFWCFHLGKSRSLLPGQHIISTNTMRYYC